MRSEMAQLTEQVRYLVQCQSNIAEVQQTAMQTRDMVAALGAHVTGQ